MPNDFPMKPVFRRRDGRAGNALTGGGPALELFMAQLADIAPRSDNSISPQSHLIEDLGFDALAFTRLALLLYEGYGVGGFSTAALRTGAHLTVEGFFQHCVVEVLGVRPQSC